MVQDQPAYQAYQGNLDYEAQAAHGYNFDQGDYLRLGSLAEVPSTLLLTTAWPQASVPTGILASQLLVKVSGNRYAMHGMQGIEYYVGENAMTPTQFYDLSITSLGELRLEAVNPTAAEGSTQNGGPLLRVVSGYTLRRLSMGDRFNLWASRVEWTDTWPAPSTQAPIKGTSVLLWAASDLEQMANPASWNGLQGRRALPWFCMKPLPNRAETALMACEWPQYRFDPGGTGMTEDVGPKLDARMLPQPSGWGTSFSWSIDAKGRLRVVGAGVETLFWNIDAGDEAADVVVYLARSPSSVPAEQSMAGVALAISGDSMPFSSSQAIGNWETATSASRRFEYPTPSDVYIVQRSVAGLGKDYTGVGGINGTAIPTTWQVAGERIYDTRYRAQFADSRSRYVQNCEQAFAEGATGCTPHYVRYFRPLMRVGQRLYGIQEFYLQGFPVYYPPGYTGPIANVGRAGGATYYECADGGCLAALPVATPAFAPQEWNRQATEVRSRSFAPSMSELLLQAQRMRH